MRYSHICFPFASNTFTKTRSLACSLLNENQSTIAPTLVVEGSVGGTTLPGCGLCTQPLCGSTHVALFGHSEEHCMRIFVTHATVSSEHCRLEREKYPNPNIAGWRLLHDTESEIASTGSIQHAVLAQSHIRPTAYPVRCLTGSSNQKGLPCAHPTECSL